MQREKPERPPLPGHGYMEDYTGAFLVAAGVLCFMALTAVWALLGWPIAVACGLCADWIMRRVG